MRYIILFSLFALLILTGCNKKPTVSNKPQVIYEKPTPAKEAKFNSIMVKIAMSTKENPNYNRISLDTAEKKAWFKTLMYRLWDRQITRKEFIAQGLKRYPKHHYEFAFIANGFQRF